MLKRLRFLLSFTFFTAVLLMIAALQVQATTYYNENGQTNIADKHNWTININGNDDNDPNNFNNTSDIFIIRSGSNVTITSSLSIKGKLYVYGELIVPSNFTLGGTGSVFVENGGVLKLRHTTLPILASPASGTVVFEASAAQNVPAINYANLTINGSGSKTLLGDINVGGALNISAGILQTGTFKVVLGASAFVVESDASYVNGTVQTAANMSSAGTYTFNGIGLELSPQVGSTNFPGATTVRRVTGTPMSGNGNQGIRRYYEIVPTINSNLNVTMVFGYLDHELNGISEANLVFYKSSLTAGPWDLQGQSLRNASANTITLNGITDFSILTLANENAPLPVSWLYFKGKASDKGNDLTWATASEKNSAVFEVERSVNGKTFETIGVVKAAGNSNQVLTYQFTDKQPLTGVTAYYRLKQIDMDGAYEYSSIITVAGKDRFAGLVSAYPNPFSETLNLQLAPNNTVEKVVLMGLDGKEVYRKDLNGYAEAVLNDLPVLKSGLYLLQLISDNGITTLKVRHQ